MKPEDPDLSRINFEDEMEEFSRQVPDSSIWLTGALLTAPTEQSDASFETFLDRCFGG